MGPTGAEWTVPQNHQQLSRVPLQTNPLFFRNKDNSDFTSAEIMVSTPRQEERRAHSGCLCVYLVEIVSAEYAEVPRAAAEQC